MYSSMQLGYSRGIPKPLSESLVGKDFEEFLLPKLITQALD